ncbi:MAG TPA: flavin reductase family protein [Phyllobacterium sp.]|nr:flavin reductase family protein [Phyllobacterium sp.]
MTAIDPRTLRDAFGAFLTGVTVVTTYSQDEEPIGFTANSFTSVSLDPPLLLVCLARTSRNFETLTNANGFAVNILSEGQKEVSNTFARPVENRFAQVDWQKGPHGSPVFSDVAAWFDCSLHKITDGGDHVILIGKVEAFANGLANGLGYARGTYFTASLTGQAVSAAASDSDVMVGAVVERDGEILLLKNEADKFELPESIIAGAAGPDGLHDYLTMTTGLPISVGQIYSVYENRASGRQHIVYRCTAGNGLPKAGQFFSIKDLPIARIATPTTGDIVQRFAAESSIGNFGVYFGTERTGKVHQIGRKV